MGINIDIIIRAIAPINNRYRDPTASPRMKLEALWEMGDQLMLLGVKTPHSVGWMVQRETKGLIKRPTVFRSYKIRTIWVSKEELLKNLGQIQGLSNLTEILPLIDPAQNVRRQLSPDQISEIYRRASCDPPKIFKRYITGLKRGFAHGRLGKHLDKFKHLDQLRCIVNNFKELQRYLLNILDETTSAGRDGFRTNTSREELRAFSNMCIALTTKDNFRLYRQLGPPTPDSQNEQFKTLYSYFYDILNKTSDVERARLRRLISADALAQMSDMVSSLDSEKSVKDFKARSKLAISL
jgi:hypothetical protein